jgi:hypothetical protein
VGRGMDNKMKYYKCDRCGDDFDFTSGMIDGQYIHVRKVQFHAPSPGWDIDRNKGESYKVKKTIELFRTIATTLQDVIYDKDLCLRCVKLLEKP